MPLRAAPTQWEPPPNFVDVAPGVWVPQNYEPTEWELASPSVQDPTEMAAEYARCEDSLSHFVIRHAWSLHVDDEGGQPAYRKIPAYPYILNFLGTVQTLDNYHLEKSRQMLVSWLWMTVFLWDILFHDNWGNLAISHHERFVDDGGAAATPDSLFGKIQVIWRCLPSYLQHEVVFRRLDIQCPATHSYIRGSAATTTSGRGPAYKRGLLDEFAHTAHSEQMLRGLRSA